MNTHCDSCSAALDHCHGTLVVHGTGRVECTDEGCNNTDRLRHSLIVDCHVMTGCGCAEPGSLSAVA